ncbi:carboxypeptidase-like regulatory domain-containing protein [Vitiosangium sp. GDMCC 1.1324]|uniref:carboxypeptidase-like regulatory domain-containing protein n=1 Tax=Vitiosangium sp. (strain GDMCC 1.1324) TaxID=2138576 RepID=UPI000D3ADC59|nr:carboxypeptidase-like regulatory domain-containing protein [Vitiosangium sp. GDMCC 1.1324]PTL83864.1 hypothetical protein DAT35_10400 [Vitiosangium sp. GDMCC 1.1324]
MRHRKMMGPALVALALVVGLLLWTRPEGATPEVGSGDPTANTSGPGSSWLSFVPALATKPTLSIRGTVRGEQGPVAGAVVLASMTVAGESLSDLPCVNASGQKTQKSIFDCHHLLTPVFEYVSRRQGEAPVVARTTSAADGSFSLEGLKAGNYSLWAEDPSGVGLRQDVAAGSTGVDLRLGASVRLWGHVLDARRAPVEGALITAIFIEHSRFFEAFTDHEGRFQFEPLPRGEYALFVSREGQVFQGKSLHAYPPEARSFFILDNPHRMSGMVLSGEQPVAGAEVRAHGSVGFDNESDYTARTDDSGQFVIEAPFTSPVFRLVATHAGLGAVKRVSFYAPSETDLRETLPEVNGIILNLAPLAEMEGLVRDEANRPVAGARSSYTSVERGGPGDRFMVMTNAEGRYRLGVITPGVSHLRVLARGHSELMEKVDLLPGKHVVDLTLSSIPVIEGILVDARGQPVEGENVELRLPEEEDDKLPLDRETTGPDGRFALDAQHPGTYQLEVGNKRTRWQRLMVEAPARLTVRTERLPSVTGELVDETGIPVPNVSIRLLSDDPTASHDLLAYSGTDRHGRFSMCAPKPGHYRVLAELQKATVTHIASQEVEVGEAGAQVRLRFEAGQPLTVVVVDRRGQPLEDTSVSVESSLRKWSDHSYSGERTGPDGRVTFQRVSGDALEVHVSKADFWRLANPTSAARPGAVRLNPGDSEVRAILVRQAFVSGRFVGRDGEPITAFTVNGEAQEDEQGGFALPIERTGILSIDLAPLPAVPGTAPVHLSVSVQEEVDLALGTLSVGP